MDNETPEMIERRMSETRRSLTDKITALEDRVSGTVDTVRRAVEDVGDVVEKVKHNVHSILDVREHVRTAPWLSVGSATTAGFLTGMFLIPDRTSPGAVPKESVETHVSNGKVPREDLLSHLQRVAEGELKKFGETAVLSLSKSLQGVVKEHLPRVIDQFIRNITPEETNGVPKNAARATT